MATISQHTLDLIAAAKAKHAAAQAAKQASAIATKLTSQPPVNLHLSTLTSSMMTSGQPLGATGLANISPLAKPATGGALRFNLEQQQAIELALQGKNFCLIGAAGTGKTTTTQEIITQLQRSSNVTPIVTATKHLIKDAPGIVVVGYTNKAVNNIRKKLPKHLQGHCLTMHKLIEYAPVYYELDSGKTTMRFEPSMNAGNPLPHISTLIFEEASMIGTELYKEVIDALPRPYATQIIFLGDINQIKPVFGPSILGFKMNELAVIELTHVYRQALESPIISIATDMRLGTNNSLPKVITQRLEIDNGEHGKVTIHPWKKRVSSEQAITFMRAFLPTLVKSGALNPAEDIILCPFNKAFGTIELNKIMAQHLTTERKDITYEVLARYIKSYWAVGDRVLVDRHEAIITKIIPTPGYVGALPQTASLNLNRWGVDTESGEVVKLTADEILNALDNIGSDQEAVNLASHTISVYLPDLGETRTLSTAGDINSMLLGYALTVHKSQGSEWQRVFLFLHASHASMLNRELIYTAITRAKHELYVICEGNIAPYINSLDKASVTHAIPGVTLADKISYFASKASGYDIA